MGGGRRKKKNPSERIQWGLLPNEQCPTSSYFLAEASWECDQTPDETVIVIFLTWQATKQTTTQLLGRQPVSVSHTPPRPAGDTVPGLELNASQIS